MIQWCYLHVCSSRFKLQQLKGLKSPYAKVDDVFLSAGVVPAGVKWDTSARLCRTWRGRWSSGSTSIETTLTPPKRRKSCSPLALKWRWCRWVQHAFAWKMGGKKGWKYSLQSVHAKEKVRKWDLPTVVGVVSFEKCLMCICNQETGWRVFYTLSCLF